MRLALIRQRYTPYGGAERFLEAALEALLERNVAITLYTREWPDTRLQLMEPHVVNPRYVGRLWRDRGFARAVCREVARADLDLVQSHERLTCCDVYRAGDGVHASWLDEWLEDKPLYVRAVTLANPYHRYVTSTERRMFANPWLRAVICNSRMVRDEIRSRFDYPEERLHVIYNAVDAAGYHPGLRQHRAEVLALLGVPPDAVVFLLVGSGYARKGVATAIRAMRELPPSAHLVVVGRETRMAAYQRLVQKLGVASRVTLAGPQLDPKPFYGAADAFVLPTIYDPFPNAALEAMACGLPVVTSTKSGAAELVLANGAGLVCPSRDVAGLVAHMHALLDPATREPMGARAREAVLPLTSEAMTLELVLLYKRLLEESAAQRKASAARRAAERERKASPPATPAAEAPASNPGAAPAAPASPSDPAAPAEPGAPPPARNGGAHAGPPPG